VRGRAVAEGARVIDIETLRARRAAASGSGRPVLVRKRKVMEHFGVSLSTVDRWIRLGMPTHQRSRRGVGFVIAECEAWHSEEFGR
jgi:predicted DNA-binding transcriptional regulator AlpA